MRRILQIDDQKRKHKCATDSLDIISFLKKFPDDLACEDFLFNEIFPNGFICTACGGKKYFRLHSRDYTLKCANQKCNAFRSLRRGTIFSNSKKSLHQWFFLIYFSTMDKQSISSLLAGKFLQIWDTTAWLMLQKLRLTMQEDRETYKLGGPGKLVQVDEIEISRKDEGPRKLLVLLEKNNYQAIERVYMTPIKHNNLESVQPILSKVLFEGSLVECDGTALYDHLKNISTMQVEKIAHHEENHTHKYLEALNTVVGNFKTGILGTFKSVRGKNLQYYCNEFCYRFNRRKKELSGTDCAFFRLLRRSIERPILKTYREFIAA